MMKTLSKRTYSGGRLPEVGRSAKVTFVFPKHTTGQLSLADSELLPPPTGLLTLATLIDKEIPNLTVAVVDENTREDLIKPGDLDSDIICISCWFSNYDRGLELAGGVKRLQRNVTILMGGPHPTGLGVDLVLRNNPSVDAVIPGEGELPLLRYLSGELPKSIEGIGFRMGDGTRYQTASEVLPLERIPTLNLDLLDEEFVWKGWSPPEPSMGAMPISSIRGCPVTPRCDYCSIATIGVRRKTPQDFWREVQRLYSQFSIDFFFETGDIFPLSYARLLLESRPPALSSGSGVRLKVYLRPGMANDRTVAILARLGVSVVFVGYESALCFHEVGAQWREELRRRHPSRSFTRTYPAAFTIDRMFDEIALFADYGIQVMPAFILGLPGESSDSLRLNCQLIRQVAQEENVSEVVVSPLLPLPGSEYFEWCRTNEMIQRTYLEAADERRGLSGVDRIDFEILGDRFIEEYTEVTPSVIRAACRSALPSETDVAVASWTG